jgi:hypothetical protein
MTRYLPACSNAVPVGFAKGLGPGLCYILWRDPGTTGRAAARAAPTLQELGTTFREEAPPRRPDFAADITRAPYIDMGSGLCYILSGLPEQFRPKTGAKAGAPFPRKTGVRGGNGNTTVPVGLNGPSGLNRVVNGPFEAPRERWPALSRSRRAPPGRTPGARLRSARRSREPAGQERAREARAARGRRGPSPELRSCRRGAAKPEA